MVFHVRYELNLFMASKACYGDIFVLPPSTDKVIIGEAIPSLALYLNGLTLDYNA
jgi:hypothetical protein